jgi:AraC-like DNA-binding protein
VPAGPGTAVTGPMPVPRAEGGGRYGWRVSETQAESVAAPPSAVLRPLVDGYRGYRLQGAPGTHRGLPSRHLTFIVSLGDPVEIARMPGREQAPGAFGAFVGGLHASTALIRHDGFQHGVSVALTPLGARALLGVPAGVLAATVVPLADLLGPAAAELVDRLAGAPGWPERFAVLDQVLGRALVDGAAPPLQVTWAWRRLVATAGGVGVGALAGDVGMSRRHLGELFRREVGLPPKVAARVLRFERARRLLERADRPPLAEVALASGYYDQAHLTRDWRELAGCPPTRWMAEELPSVQDAAPERARS